MSDDFVSRWSRRKLEAKRETPAHADAAQPAPPPSANVPEPPLPPIESLTSESDITAFMKPHVEAALKRQAIKTILRDPRFNVMDGLDVYIDDYSLPDPIPPEWLGKLNQMARLGDYKEPPADAPPAEPLDPSGESGKPTMDQPVGVAEGEVENAPTSHTDTAANPPPIVRES